MGQWGLNKNAAAGGTTPEDLQQIFAAEWYNANTCPVIKGGAVTGRGNLQYDYAAGVGLVKTAHGVVKVSWPAGTTQVIDTPSVTRTDVIYVDLAGLVHVAVEGTVNENTVCVIDKMTLPGGATATSAATRSRSRNFALPYGANLGWIAAYGEFRSGSVPTPETMFNRGFWVPTDSKVDFIVKQAIFGDRGTHPDSDARSLGIGWCRYAVYLDNLLLETFEISYNRGYSVGAWEMLDKEVTEGEHTLRVERVSTAGAPPLFFGGGTEKLSGGFVGVRHNGVAE